MNRPRLGLSRALACGAILALSATAACTKTPRYRAGGGIPAAKEGPGLPGSTAVGEMSLNRGDWLVGETSGIWKVLADSGGGTPPQPIGHLVARHYREMRGGPVFTMYEVTTLDRHEHVGMIDALGNAIRFVPRRQGGYDSVPAGNSTLEFNVQAIFDTLRPITLEPTSERRLAFEGLDANHDGGLSAEEWPRVKETNPRVDRNGDGKVDYQEFDAIDSL